MGRKDIPQSPSALTAVHVDSSDVNDFEDLFQRVQLLTNQKLNLDTENDEAIEAQIIERQKLMAQLKQKMEEAQRRVQEIHLAEMDALQEEAYQRRLWEEEEDELEDPEEEDEESNTSWYQNSCQQAQNWLDNNYICPVKTSRYDQIYRILEFEFESLGWWIEDMRLYIFGCALRSFWRRSRNGEERLKVRMRSKDWECVSVELSQLWFEAECLQKDAEEVGMGPLFAHEVRGLHGKIWDLKGYLLGEND